MPPTALYLHVPFCVRRCLYCDFYVLPLGDGPIPARLHAFRSMRHRGFLAAMEAELAALPDGFRPLTVYIGGGTPTELPPEDLRRMFEMVERHVDLSRVSEFTCEANPGTLDADMAGVLAESPADRVSLGVQSFDGQVLESLGRIHDAAEAAEATHLLRGAGIRNISVDLLFAVPGAGPAVVDTNLRAIAELNPEHVSWYSLEFEPGTAFTDMRDKGFLREPDDAACAEAYHRIREGLLGLGFEHYELFSFTRPGHACAHNLNYWAGGEFHGCGPSAHSHVYGARGANPADLARWIRQQTGLERREEAGESLPPEAKARERLMTRLRLTAGVDERAFTRDTGFAPADLIPARTLEEWLRAGRLLRENGTIRLDPTAYLVSDSLFREFV